jgi:plastocyanin
MNLFKLRRIGLAVAVAMLSATLASACGGGGDDGGNADKRSGGTIEIPEGAPFVDQDNLKFSPTELTVKVGEKVYFKNSETALHTVDVEGENVSGNMKKDDVFVFEFPSAGTYDITCAYHPQMKAKITVVE